jgi:biotin transport system substrate-specific component
MNSYRTIAPSLHEAFTNRTVQLSVIGTLVLVACTQVRIPLPFTPVPVTGQTFAVIAWPLLFGYRIGLSSVLTYLALGCLGAPVFAGFESMSALWGPTSGYLIGFAAAAALLGRLRDAGLTSTPMRLGLSVVGAQAIILLCGSLVLSTFVGAENAIVMGIAPFLAGDVIKSVLLFTMIRSVRWNEAK